MVKNHREPERVCSQESQRAREGPWSRITESQRGSVVKNHREPERVRGQESQRARERVRGQEPQRARESL